MVNKKVFILCVAIGIVFCHVAGITLFEEYAKVLKDKKARDAFLQKMPQRLADEKTSKDAALLLKTEWSPDERRTLLDAFLWLPNAKFFPAFGKTYVDSLSAFLVGSAKDVPELAFEVAAYLESLKTVFAAFEAQKQKPLAFMIQMTSLSEGVLEKLDQNMKTERTLPNLCKRFGCDENEVWLLEDWREYARKLFDEELRKEQPQTYSEIQKVKAGKALQNLASALSELAGT